MTRWLVVGSAGQLGHDLISVLGATGSDGSAPGRPNPDVIGLDLPEINIVSARSVRHALTEHRPDVVINAAAYTAVDRAEDEVDLAEQINAVGPDVLASACAELPGTRLVQLSTDYVFSGEARSPYAEDAPTDPRSVYGRTKLAGEQAVLRLLPERGFVVRTAWLYGQHGNNFVKTMLRLAQTNPTLSVVADQTGQPTWSRDLAEQILRLMSHGAASGIYHGTNSGRTTWYSFTREIFRLAGLDPDRVSPATTSDFPRPAPRPAYSVLGHARWRAAGIAPMRPWSQALAEALPAISSQLAQDS